MSSKYMIEFTTIIGCPCKCSYCPQEKFTSRYNSNIRVITPELMTKYIETIPSDIVISLAGFSEPLLNPYILDILDILRGRRLMLYTTLHNVSINVVKQIALSGIDELTLHLPDEYTAMKVDDNYVRKLRVLLQLTKSTVKVVGFTTPPESINKLLTLYKDKVSLVQISNRYLNDRAGNLPSLPKNYKHGNIKCVRPPFYHVLPNGDVTICGQDFGLDFILGNLNTSSMRQILNGEILRKYIKGLTDESIPTLCRKCSESYNLTKGECLC